MELENRESKYREVKIKREIEKLFFKPATLSIDDMNKSQQKTMKKKRPIENTVYVSDMSYVSYMSYVNCMSCAGYMNYVSYMSYISYISYVNYMNIS